MRGISLFILIALLPAIAALGHDLYLFYTFNGVDTLQSDLSQNIEDKGIGGLFASLGFIWTQYEPESYKWVVQNTDRDSWAMINAFLAQKAFFVGLAFAGVLFAILGLMKISGIGPYSGSKSGPTPLRGKKTGQFKYKRK